MALELLVCGSGSGAHVLAGIAAAQPKTETRVLTLCADKAERWMQAIKEDEFVITRTESDGSQSQIRAMPLKVLKCHNKIIEGRKSSPNQ